MTIGEIEYRTATALEVRHAQRIIELIAVPYNEPTRVLHRGRWITEVVKPTAFTGVSGEVTVNRAHNRERPVGRVVSLHPGDPRGLRAELRISRTSEGDDLLELAADELISASVGFAPLPGGEEYNVDRSTRTITKAILDHVALTGDPAYTGAKVLAVRTADELEPGVVRVPTPNLDRIRLELLAARTGIALAADLD